MRIGDMRGTFAEWCDQLASAPCSPSLDHGDLHPWNILVGSGATVQARFYDWGDTSGLKIRPMVTWKQ